MKEIERMIWKHEGLNKADVSDEYRKSVITLTEAIEQYVVNVLEGLKYKENKEWMETNIVYPERVNNRIDEAIAELKKGLT